MRFRVGRSYLYLFFGISICLLILTSGCKKSENVQVLLTGIDVSHYNGEIDWTKVKADGISFAFIKATQGARFVDPDLQKNSLSADKNQIITGYYHFFVPGDDPILQARNFLKNIPKQPMLPPVLDIEIDDKILDATLLKELKVWVTYVENALHTKPIIYSYRSFWHTYFHDQFEGYPLWIAEYNPYELEPGLPAGHRRWNFWQVTQRGEVAGVRGHVDRNFFNGTFDQLKAMVK